ncbi:MAG: aspartate/glutamate racemase family protein [Silicimonas sp.]|nr:aspartate/glutamate racemase family protein [Silicimonas sp.]
MDNSASIGILMLSSHFPRIPGDMGNAQTWDFPVVYRVVRHASPDQVVLKGAEGLLPVFIAAAKELEAEGVAAITTTCGFLCTFQQDLAKAVSVPVVTSSLFQVASINALLPPGKRAGVLTISADSLSEAHLKAAGVPEGTPISAPKGHFVDVILNDQAEMDVLQAESENVEAAQLLVRNNPSVAAIVLECTNMTPYTRAIGKAVNLPIFSAVSYIKWLQGSLAFKQ